MIDLDNISFDHCIKCTVCTIYCPVARATHHFFGPKQCGPDAERLRIKNPELVDATLTYCTNCKRCEVACPSEVKIADIIQTAKSEAEKLIERAKHEIEMSRDKVIHDIRELAIELSMQATEKLISKKLTREDHDSMIRAAMERMEQFN